MATLSNPTLSIDLLTGSDPNVTATVDVAFTQLETGLISLGLNLNFQLAAKLRGEDGGLNGRDNDLFLFPTQNITIGGTYTFQSIVSYGTLDEDNGLFNERDEIYANFNLFSTEQIFSQNVSLSSPIIEGNF